MLQSSTPCKSIFAAYLSQGPVVELTVDLLSNVQSQQADSVDPRSGAPPPPPRLKVILMSATLDAALFADYFGGCAGESALGTLSQVA